MARHVVRAFGCMPIKVWIARHQTVHEIFEIGENIRIGILLNKKGCGSVTDETGQETIRDPRVLYEAADGIGERVEPGPPRGDFDRFRIVVSCRRLFAQIDIERARPA